MSTPRILDDLAKFAGGTMSFVSSARAGAKQELRSRIDEFAERMDLVPREEFEKLETILQQTRQKQESLEERLQALEKETKKPHKKAKA